MSSSFPTLNDGARCLIVEVARALEPYFTDITARWRDSVEAEFRLDRRAEAALERLNIAAGCTYFCHGDFDGFYENVQYFSNRLAKLQVDTRLVSRSLQLYLQHCEPYLNGLFTDRRSEARAALSLLQAETFVAASGAYFDARANESSALLSVLDAELSATDAPTLLRRILEITTATFPANIGFVLLKSDSREELQISAMVGADESFQLGQTIAIGQGFAGAIALTGQPALSLDAMNDERILSSALRQQAKSLWGVPLKIEQEIIGVLLIGFDRPYEWLPTERELMRAIASRSALGIERARITDTLREREARIAELSGHLLKVQEEERKRISRELHDETGQALMVIRLYLGMLEETVRSQSGRNKIKETVEVVDRTIEGIRRIIGKLSPLVLQELGLVAAIRKEAKDIGRTARLKIRVAVPDTIGRLTPEAEAALYRVVQEALHNVAKHASAQNVGIEVERAEGEVRLLVEDDGVGFTPMKSNSRGHSFGLVGIKERVGMLGGSVQIDSARGKGTRLRVTVPVRQQPERMAVAAAAGLPASKAKHSVQGGLNA